MNASTKKHGTSIESMEDLNSLFEQAVKDVREIAAPAIGESDYVHPFRKELRLTNNRKRLGSCRIRQREISGFVVSCEFEISISRILFHSYEQTESVMYHEVIHMLPGCFNHGAKFKQAADAINKALGISVETTYNAERHDGINPDGTRNVTFDGENLTLNDIVAAFGKTMRIGRKTYRIDGYEARRPKYCIKVTDMRSNRQAYMTKNAFADAYVNGRIH